jgi:antitoxin VapB
MLMSVNIKNPETERLTRELAGLTGESITTTITVAVGERLARLRSDEGADDTAERTERILWLAHEIGARIPEPWASTPHGDLLYDERGLPA